jgi:hypothetical protein
MSVKVSKFLEPAKNHHIQRSTLFTLGFWAPLARAARA